MRYVSLFSGVEAASVAWSRLGWEPLAFAEVDEFPAAVLACRFPDVPNLGDVCKIDWREFYARFGNVDVLVGGSPCFVAGTLVLCESGFKPIEQVKVGEKVVTHKGRLKRVLRTGSKRAEIGTLKVHGMLPIRCTPNHPVLASRRTKRAKADEYGSWFNFHGEQFVAASESVGMCACSVEDVECDIPDYPKVYAANHSDITELIGWYLGDGSIGGKGRRNPSTRELSLSINYKKLDEFESRFSKSVSYRVVRIDEARCKVLISCTGLCDFLETNFGKGAEGKNIPPWVFALDDGERQRLFDGYLATDGTTRNDGVSSIESVSKPLIIGMQMLMKKGSACMPAHRRITEIKGVEYATQQTYKYSLPAGGGRVCHDGGYSKRLVDEYTPCGNDRVYNLEVEDDNSYTADGIAAHNCQSFSIAGNRTGLEGASGLMWQFCRAIRELVEVSGGGGPRYVLWENVPGALSSGPKGQKGEDFGCLLRELANCGYGLAWRVLDSQFARVPDGSPHGFAGPVPQRRRRVFLVGSLGTDGAGDILFERTCLRGDHSKGREAREALAEHLEVGAGMGDSAGFKYHAGKSAGGIGYEVGSSPTLTADYHQPAIMFRGDTTPKFSEDVSITLRVGGDGGTHDAVALAGGLPRMSRCMKCGCAAEAEIDDPQEPQQFWRWSVGCSNMGCEDYVHPRKSFKTVEEAAADWNEHCRRYVRDTLDGAPDVLTPWDVQSKRVNTPEGTSPTLPSGTGEGMNIQPIVMTTANTNANGSNVNQDGACYMLDGANSNAVAFAQNTRDEVRLFGGDGQTVGALSAQPGMKQTSYVCMQDGQAHGAIEEELSTTLNASHEQPIVCAADDNGKTAIEEDLCGSLKVGGGSP